LPEIKTIHLPLPYRLGSVNCYLLQAEVGFVLVDTGASRGRTRLVEELDSAGCRLGNLVLTVLTHGDFDHAGNCAYLRQAFGTPIAMHRDDAGMVERGDMFWNRQSGNGLVRLMAPLLFGFHKSHRFEPDLYLEDGTDLSEYGLDAQILALPGHSQGSIGVLTAGGDLFCGDLLENEDKPSLNSIMDDPATANASIEKLKSLEINTVYPGHGKPFPMAALIEEHRNHNSGRP
jgi:glyoxylase-like metal-dependent hydrolase (beta-lactamase superfamily II)